MITTQQDSLGLWYIFLGGDVLTGGWLTEGEAINEMELLK
ncbi:TMhelix containing protein [Vibrio phage 1.265.O._10N.286.52.F6]|nr:TMhelix containing protein [Vibrio phage 1.265.O._10N.286.52.F6]